jgi:hypothetical protein
MPALICTSPGSRSSPPCTRACSYHPCNSPSPRARSYPMPARTHSYHPQVLFVPLLGALSFVCALVCARVGLVRGRLHLRVLVWAGLCLFVLVWAVPPLFAHFICLSFACLFVLACTCVPWACLRSHVLVCAGLGWACLCSCGWKRYNTIVAVWEEVVELAHERLTKRDISVWIMW